MYPAWGLHHLCGKGCFTVTPARRGQHVPSVGVAPPLWEGVFHCDTGRPASMYSVWGLHHLCGKGCFTVTLGGRPACIQRGGCTTSVGRGVSL